MMLRFQREPIGCVGLVSRPWAKVSAANRYEFIVDDWFRNGSIGSKTARNVRASNPTTTTEERSSAGQMVEVTLDFFNQLDPRDGKANAPIKAMSPRIDSIRSIVRLG
jgi:hypothetical protein